MEVRIVLFYDLFHMIRTKELPGGSPAPSLPQKQAEGTTCPLFSLRSDLGRFSFCREKLDHDCLDACESMFHSVRVCATMCLFSGVFLRRVLIACS